MKDIKHLSSFALLTFVVLATQTFGQDSASQKNCVVTFDLPAETTIKTSKRDFGTSRKITYSKLAPGKIYYNDFELRFPSGAILKKRVLLEIGRDVTVAELDPRSSKPELMLQNNDSQGGVAWSESGKYVLAGRVLCDAATGKQLRAFPNPIKPPKVVAISPDETRVALGARANPFQPNFKNTDKVYVYDLNSGRLVHEFVGLANGSDALVFSVDGMRLAVGGEDGRGNSRTKKWESWGAAKIFDVESGKLIRSIRSDFGIGALALSPSGRTVLTAGGGLGYISRPSIAGKEDAATHIKLWDIASGRLVRSFSGFDSAISAVDFAPNGKKILAASHDQSIAIWDATTGRMLHRLLGCKNSIDWLKISSKGNALITQIDSWTGSSQFMVWTLPLGNYRNGFKLPVKPNSIEVSADGKRLLIGAQSTDSQNAKVLLVDTLSGKILWSRDSDNSIRQVALASNGKMGAHSGSGVQFWDADTGRNIKSFENSSDIITFSPDSKSVLIEKNSKTLALIDASSFAEIKTFEIEGYYFEAANFSPDGKFLIAGTNGSKEKNSIGIVWDIATGKKLNQFDCSDRYVDRIAVSNDGTLALVQLNYDEAILIEVSSGKRIKEFETRCDISPDGKKVISFKKTGEIWDIATQSVIGNIGTHRGWVDHAEFISDGAQIVSGGNYSYFDKKSHAYGQAILWDADTGEQLLHIDELQGRVDAYAASPDGNQVLTNQGNGTVMELATGKVKHRVFAQSGKIRSVFDHKGNLFGQVAHEKGHDTYDFGTSEKLVRMTGTEKKHQTNMEMSDSNAMAVSRDGEFIVSPNKGKKTLALRKFESAKLIHTFIGHRWEIDKAEFSPNGRYLVSWGDNPNYQVEQSEIIIWDTGNGRQLHRLLRPHRYVNATFSPDSRRLLTWARDYVVERPASDGQREKGRFDGVVQLWDVGSGQQLLKLPSNQPEGQSATFSPDGRYVVTDAQDKKLATIVWDASTGRRIREFQNDDWHSNICFSSDGRYIATTSTFYADRGIIYVWNFSTGKLLRTIKNPQGGIYSLRFLDDSRTLMSDSRGGEVHLWDATNGDRLARILSVGLDGDWIALTPEGLFDGTPAARQQITYRVGGGLNVVPVDRFFQDFYRPGLIQELLGAERPLPDVEVGAKAAPRIRILSPERGGDVEASTAKIEVEVIDRGGGIKGPWLLHNGANVIVPGTTRRNGKTSNRTFSVPLVEGENSFEVLAATQDGSWESEPARVVLNYSKPLAKSHLFLLAVGINKYDESSMNLQFAAHDAKAMSRLFTERGAAMYGKSNVHVTELLDEQATKKGIKDAIKSIAEEAKPQDNVIVFLAGHGTIVGQRYYFVPHEFKSKEDSLEDSIREQCLAGDEFDDAVNSLPALRRIVIYDTCSSGGAVSVSRMARNPFAFRKAMEQMSRSQGSFVIAATAATDDAQEVPELGHGVLTYTLLAAMAAVDKGPLKRRALKGNDDSVVNVMDWFGFAQNEVPHLTRTLFGQEQFVRFSGAGQNFPVLPLNTD